MKRLILMACVLTMAVAASAQYPDLTDEAKRYIEDQKKQWQAHSDSAWAVAFPIVVEEAKVSVVRTFPGPVCPMICAKLRFPHFLELKVVVCTHSADEVVRC